MFKHLISVLIPTRNRQKYAEAAIRQILALNQDIQVIVEDNSDENLLIPSLNDIKDNTNLVCQYIPERIAFIDNYNNAAKYADGEYLIALGDDDALLPDITEIVLWMKKEQIDAIKPSNMLEYFWPDEENVHLDARKGLLKTSYFSGSVKFFDPRKSIIQLLKNGGQDYNDLPMAGTYHRIVRFELLNKVYIKTGRYFGGLSPDMYSAVALSLLSGIRFAEVDFPVSIPGICPLSASAASEKGQHCGKLETAPHFIGMKEKYMWDRRVPRYYSVETIWAETCLKAISDMGYKKIIDKYFDDSYLKYQMFNRNANKREEMIKVLGDSYFETSKNKPSDQYVRVFCKRALRYAKKKIPGNSITIQGCKDILDAVSKIDSFLSSSKMISRKKKLLNS